VQYDDGFVAYLNGHQVASRNAPRDNCLQLGRHGQGVVDGADLRGGRHAVRAGDARGSNYPPVVQSGYLRLMPAQNSVNEHDRLLPDLRAIRVDRGRTSTTACRRTRATGRRRRTASASRSPTRRSTAPRGRTVHRPGLGAPDVPSAFSVGFDIWNGGNENTVSVNWNGQEVAAKYITQFR